VNIEENITNVTANSNYSYIEIQTLSGFYLSGKHIVFGPRNTNVDSDIQAVM